MLNLEYKLI